jgi:phosphoribosylformylglycinamidine synthase
VGNPVLYVGSKTGRDGIHGATMASAEFSEATEEKRPTVQVGDPFTEKLLLEACLELMAEDVIVGIQDMGAAGLTSSSFEMAGRAGSGIRFDLDKVPMREKGMTPYEILLSESQERMLIVAQKGREDRVKAIFGKWGLDAAEIGVVTDTGRAQILWHGEVVVDMPVGPVSDQAPLYNRPLQEPEDFHARKAAPLPPVPKVDPGEALLTLVGSPNLCSRRWVYTQYDQSVRTNTVLGPGADAALIRIKGTNKAVAMTTDVNPRYCKLDPFEGGRLAVAEAARNIACVGARPLAITDCLNFGNPERPEVMWEFSQSVDGISEACRALDTPVVSGNVSFYNETNGVGIHPTPMIGMVGLLEDVSCQREPWFLEEGDSIILLGTSKGHLGGSEFLWALHGVEAGTPPPLDLRIEKALLTLLQQLCREGMARSVHDLSDGGLLVAVAECCMAPRHSLGARLDLDPSGMEREALLFGEDSSRAVVTCAPGFELAIRDEAAALGVRAKVIGKVGGDRLSVLLDGQPCVDLAISELRAAWENGLKAVVG